MTAALPQVAGIAHIPRPGRGVAGRCGRGGRRRWLHGFLSGDVASLSLSPTLSPLSPSCPLRLRDREEVLHHRHRPDHPQHARGDPGEAGGAGGGGAPRDSGADALPPCRGGWHPVHLQPAGDLRGRPLLPPGEFERRGREVGAGCLVRWDAGAGGRGRGADGERRKGAGRSLPTLSPFLFALSAAARRLRPSPAPRPPAIPHQGLGLSFFWRPFFGPSAILARTGCRPPQN